MQFTAEGDASGVSRGTRQRHASRASPPSSRSPATPPTRTRGTSSSGSSSAPTRSYTLPPGRDNVKVFPVSTHLLSKLRGPLAVEGGPTAADRSLRNGVKLAGREGRRPLRDPGAGAGELADRRPQRLQRLEPGRRRRHDDLDDADRVRHVEGPRVRHGHRVRRADRPSRAGSASGRSPSSAASSRPTARRARSRC